MELCSQWCRISRSFRKNWKHASLDVLLKQLHENEQNWVESGFHAYLAFIRLASCSSGQQIIFSAHADSTFRASSNSGAATGRQSPASVSNTIETFIAVEPLFNSTASGETSTRPAPSSALSSSAQSELKVLRDSRKRLWKSLSFRESKLSDRSCMTGSGQL